MFITYVCLVVKREWKERNKWERTGKDEKLRWFDKLIVIRNRKEKGKKEMLIFLYKNTKISLVN